MTLGWPPSQAPAGQPRQPKYSSQGSTERSSERLTALLPDLPTCLVTHSLTYSLPHSLTHSLIYSFIHPLIHPLIHRLIYSLTDSFTHSSSYSFAHSFIHSSTYSFTHPLIHSLTHLFIHSPTLSFIYLLIHSFTESVTNHLFSYSLIHSLNHSFIYSSIYTLIHSFTHSFMHSLTHSFTESVTHYSLSRRLSKLLLSKMYQAHGREVMKITLPMNGALTFPQGPQNSRAEFMEVRKQPCSSWPGRICLEKSLRKAASAWSLCDSGTVRQLRVLNGKGKQYTAGCQAGGEAGAGQRGPSSGFSPRLSLGPLTQIQGSINAHAEASFCPLILRS